MPRKNETDDPPSGLRPWHWFVLSAAAPLVHCASRLDLDLWHDEIYTVDHFVSRGPAAIVTDYSLPNNHVFYSLALWPFYLLSDADFVLRLPSFFFTVGTLIFIFSLAYRYSGVVGAVASTSLLGLNQMFLIHTIQVRGYGLSMFLTACLAWLALADSNRRRRLLAVPFVGAALLYVMPTNLLVVAPLAAASLCLCAVRRPGFGQIAADAAAWAVAGLLALGCYLPIAVQVRAAAESASPSSWSSLPEIAQSFLQPATHDAIWLAPLLVLSLLALGYRRSDGAPRCWSLPIVASAVLVGAFLLTGLLRISPFERNYCPLLVWLALLGGWLLADLSQSTQARILVGGSAEKAAVILLVLLSILFWPQLWTYAERLRVRRERADAADQWVANGYYCYYAANYRPSAVVDYLAVRDFNRAPFGILYTKPDFLNLWWYFYHSPLANVRTPDGKVTVFAILPEPPPWKALAKDCHLSDEDVRAFELIDDFGFYRLYRTPGLVDVGPSSGAHSASQSQPSTAQ
ncbi:MAG TPA: hypothetical protein VFI31_20630 [Pirellulales bacterium]|nr:hypothetical protein [Pirellulales bacterium]